MFKTIVAGSRYWKDYEFIKGHLDILLANKLPNVQIISGGALGVDTLGEKWALANGINPVRITAQWEKYGKAAGPIRNRQMAEMADACIVFTSGGPGSTNMINVAKELGLNLRVIGLPAHE